jgi:TRAP-type mannitol/chloroaromatic compound transport system substrate-binding protein
MRGTDPDHCIGHILLNKKSYEALPDDLKKVVSDAAKSYWKALLKVHKEELAKVAELVKAGKVKESWIDAACQKTHQEAALKLWDKIAKRDPAAAKAIAMIKKWRGLK